MHDVVGPLGDVKVLDVLIDELSLPAKRTNVRDSLQLCGFSLNRSIWEVKYVLSPGSLKGPLPSARCLEIESGEMCVDIASARNIEPRIRKACPRQ
jgi:hypothetical protein